MQCRDVQHYYWQYQARSLSAGLMSEIDAHLATCPECTLQFEACRDIDRQLAQLEEIEPSPYFDQKLKVKLDAASEKSAQPFRFSFWFRPRSVMAFSVFLIALASLWIGLRYQQSSSAPGGQEIAVRTPPANPGRPPIAATPGMPATTPIAALPQPAEPSTAISAEDDIPAEDVALLKDMELLQNYDLLKSMEFSQDDSEEPLNREEN